jgi:hypothetical protein
LGQAIVCNVELSFAPKKRVLGQARSSHGKPAGSWSGLAATVHRENQWIRGSCSPFGLGLKVHANSGRNQTTFRASSDGEQMFFGARWWEHAMRIEDGRRWAF